jgi:hypothetical protein
MQKNNYAIYANVCLGGIHLDDKIQKAKKSEMFFCILSSTDDKTIAKGVLQSKPKGASSHRRPLRMFFCVFKQRSKSLEEFRDNLYKLNGASTCLDNDILPTQFQLIGKPVPAGVRFPPAFTSVNLTCTFFFWGSSFNDGTTQTALDPPGGGAGSHPLRVQTMVGGR